MLLCFVLVGDIHQYGYWHSFYMGHMGALLCDVEDIFFWGWELWNESFFGARMTSMINLKFWLATLFPVITALPNFLRSPTGFIFFGVGCDGLPIPFLGFGTFTFATCFNGLVSVPLPAPFPFPLRSLLCGP